MTHYHHDNTFMGHMTQIMAMDSSGETSSVLALLVIEWDQVGFSQTPEL